jgi:LPXTG-site transpeptidase (sortase) family protein
MCAFQTLTYTGGIGSEDRCLYGFCVIRHTFADTVSGEEAGVTHGARRWRRAAGNVLLGVSLGLLAYYSLTTLMGWLAQRDLREQVADVPVFVDERPGQTITDEGPPLDFDGWEGEDLAWWSALAPGTPFARLAIPAMDLDALVVNGVTPADLRRGPGWIDWTDLPGPSGTVGISGHRTTYGAPFRRLGELAEGDTIDLFSPYRRYRYEVTATLVVTPDQVEVVASTEPPTLTLTACHPPYSAAYRLAVQADLVEVRRLESDIE